MDIIKSSELYLHNLYLKSKNNFKAGYDETAISQLSGNSRLEAENIVAYLEGKLLIQTGKYKSDPNIYLTSQAMEYVAKQKQNKIHNTIKFTGASYLQPTGRAVITYLFYYDLIDETGKATNKLITVMISDQQALNWGYQFWSHSPGVEYKDLVKILLQFAKDKIIEKIKEGTLTNHEEMILLTTNSPTTKPFDAKFLPEVENAEFEVEIGQKSLGLEIKENKLAASIIEARDIINTLFHQKYKDKLMLLNQERNLLDFFKTAASEEEFSHRIASLAEVSRNLNIEVLRKATGSNDTQIKSVQLLKLFFEQHNIDGKKVTDTLVGIGRVRQGYPTHTDLAGIISALDFFNLKYPLIDYEGAWVMILNEYLVALVILKDILINLFISNNSTPGINNIISLVDEFQVAGKRISKSLLYNIAKSLITHSIGFNILFHLILPRKVPVESMLIQVIIAFPTMWSSGT